MNQKNIRVTLLLWLVLSLTVMNMLRLWTALSWRIVLDEFGTRPGLAISLTGSSTFSVIGLVLVCGIWQKKTWTAGLVAASGTGYTIWYWTERFLFQEPRSNIPFAVSLNLVLLLFIYSTSIYLAKEAHER